MGSKLIGRPLVSRNLAIDAIFLAVTCVKIEKIIRKHLFKPATSVGTPILSSFLPFEASSSSALRLGWALRSPSAAGREFLYIVKTKLVKCIFIHISIMNIIGL
jgi:hypothetical protein